MPGRARRRYTTFLVSVAAERSHGRGKSAPLVYAVMTPNAEEALAAVGALSGAQAGITIVGSLSARVSKTLKLKPDEPRVV